MKYVAIWLGTVAVLTLLALVLYGGLLLVAAVVRDPSLFWVPAIVVGIVAIATLAAVVEFLTDRRPTAVEVDQ